MIVSDEQAKRFLRPLYHVAENDRNDVIANAASSFAVRLEKHQRTHHLSDADSKLLKYAMNLSPPTIFYVDREPKRKTYKRRYS